MEETDDQKKDRRLERYIVREQLVSIMNDTKWERLRQGLLHQLDFTPDWGEKYVRDAFCVVSIPSGRMVPRTTSTLSGSILIPLSENTAVRC